MSKIWNRLTDWEKSPINAYFENKHAEWRLKKLIVELTDGDKAVRDKATWVLGWLGDASAVPALVVVLNDEYVVVRRNAARALGTIAKKNPESKEILEAVPALIVALENEDLEVGQQSANILGAIGVPAVPALSDALGGEDSTVKLRVIEALEEIGDNSAIPELLIVALKDKHPDIRWRATGALGKIKPRDYKDLLLIRSAAREARKDGGDTTDLLELYNMWSKQLRASANEYVSSAKNLPKPRVPRKPGSIERVMRIQRVVE